MAVYHEFEIQSHLQCPMLDLPQGIDGALGCSLEVLHWAVQEAFDGRLVSVANLRRRFEIQLNKSRPVKDKAFYNAIRQGNAAASRIYMFLQSYEVVMPMAWYDLSYLGDRITGEYAVVKQREKRGSQLPMILLAHDSKPRHYPFVGPVEIFRYLDLMVKSAYTDAGIYHLPFVRGKAWQHRNFDLPLVRRAAQSILSTMKHSGFPVPGLHCADCQSKACRSIANV
jgi:hypothetical protein